MYFGEWKDWSHSTISRKKLHVVLIHTRAHTHTNPIWILSFIICNRNWIESDCSTSNSIEFREQYDRIMCTRNPFMVYGVTTFIFICVMKSTKEMVLKSDSKIHFVQICMAVAICLYIMHYKRNSYSVRLKTIFDTWIGFNTLSDYENFTSETTSFLFRRFSSFVHFIS